MPGACQLSGNVVPAVGMCEGAKPLRIQGLAITKPKVFIQFPKVNQIYIMFRPAIKMFQKGQVLSHVNILSRHIYGYMSA